MLPFYTAFSETRPVSDSYLERCAYRGQKPLVTLSGPEPIPGSRQEKNKNHASALLQLGLLLLGKQYNRQEGARHWRKQKRARDLEQVERFGLPESQPCLIQQPSSENSILSLPAFPLPPSSSFSPTSPLYSLLSPSVFIHLPIYRGF